MNKSIGIFLFALFSTLIFMLPHYLWDTTVFYVFQTRDLLRAQKLLHGEMIFWGPEMTGGGTLPGPFYYFLLAASQLVSLGWQSAWLWLVASECAGCLIGFFAFRRAGMRTASYLWLAAFALAPKTAFFTTEFYNVSFMSVFVILSLIALQAAFTHSSLRARQVATFCLFGLSGLAIQLHFTAVVLPAAFLLTYFLRRPLQLVAVDARTVRTGCFLFIALLLPYAFWLSARRLGFDFGQEFDFAGDPQEAPWKMVSLLAERKGRLGFESLVWELKMVVPIMFPPLALAAIWLRRADWTHGRESNHLNLWPFAIAAVCGLVPVLDELISPQAFRYGMPLYITLVALSVVLFERMLRARDLRAFLTFIVAGAGYSLWLYADLLAPSNYWEIAGPSGAALQIFALLALAALIVVPIRSQRAMSLLTVFLFLALALAQSRPMLVKITSQPRPMPNLADWKAIWKRFREVSNQDYAQVIRKIYFVNHHKEQDPEIGFRLKGGVADFNQAAAFDGYFVSAFFPGGDVREWLLKNKLQDDILSGLKTGAIHLELEDPIRPRGILVVGYKILDERYPRYFQNTGEGYTRSADSRVLDRIKMKSGATRLENGDLIFKWNDCPSHADYCSTGAVLQIEKLERDRYSIRVRVIGSPLAQSSPWIHPEWTEAWIAPYLEVRCGPDRHRFNLLSSIGYRRQLGLGVIRLMGANHSVLAPSEYNFSETCAQGIQSIAFGRKATMVEQINQIVELPNAELSFSLQP